MKELKAVNGSLTDTDVKTVSYSTRKDGINRELEVKEVENGFIIEVTESGEKEVNGEKEWYHARQLYISSENPLKDEDDNYSDVVKKALKNLKV